jgi:antirestriction protein ArdC
MEWYIVVKTINGRRYRYWQKTWREGKRVRTANKYIGPAGGVVFAPAIPADATTLPLPFPVHRPREIVTSGEVQTIFDGLLQQEGQPNWKCPWSKRKKINEVITNTVIETMVSKLRVYRTSYSDGAYFSPSGDMLNMPPKHMFGPRGNSSATDNYYQTLCHELIHWTGRHNRLDRLDTIGLSKLEGYAREELVAEAGALILMQKLGILPRDTSASVTYFKTWLSRIHNKEEAISYAQREAERAVNYILEHGFAT